MNRKSSPSFSVVVCEQMSNYDIPHHLNTKWLVLEKKKKQLQQQMLGGI